MTQHALEPGVFMNWEIKPDIMGSVPHGFPEIDGERVGIHHLATTVTPDEIEALWQESSQRVVSVRDRHFSEGPLSSLRVLDLGGIVVGAETARLFAPSGRT